MKNIKLICISLFLTLQMSHAMSQNALSGLVYAGEHLINGVLNLDFPTAIEPDMVWGFLPGLEVIYNQPLNLGLYGANGGTLLSPSLAPIPAIPFLSQPIIAEALIGPLSSYSSTLAEVSPKEIASLLLTDTGYVFDLTMVLLVP